MNLAVVGPPRLTPPVVADAVPLGSTQDAVSAHFSTDVQWRLPGLAVDSEVSATSRLGSLPC